MYILSKLIPLIISPLGMIIILLFLYIFRKKAKFIYSSLLFLLVFSNGIISNSLLKLIESPWKRLDYTTLKYADGIVVLSGSRHLPPGNTNIIEWKDPDRFFAGINLYRANKSSRLIFTGGVNPFVSNLPPEGDIYLKEAISMGIPKEDLYTTYPVFNTLQEAKAIRKLLNKEISSNQKKIILVTSAFHMKRAKKVFEKEGIKVIPYPVDFKSEKSFLTLLKNPIKWMPSSYHLNETSIAIREIIGRIYYKAIK